MVSLVRPACVAALVTLFAHEAAAKPKPKNPKRAEVVAAPADPPPAPAVAPAPAPAPVTPPVRVEDRAAEPTPEAKPVGVGVLAGIATAGLSAGFGARGGYTFPVGVYVGGTAVYHIGTSVFDTRVSFLYAGVEGGYDFKAGPVVIRPYGGLGPLTAFGGDGSKTAVGLWPGATVLYPIPDSIFTLGGDVRVLIGTGGGDASLGFLAYAGARL